MYNNWKKTFADEQVGVDGLLYKAGLTELADTIDGYGRGYDGVEWYNLTGTAAISNGGIKCNAGGSIDITPTDGAGRPSAIREALKSRGAFQIDIYADEICIGQEGGDTDPHIHFRAYSDAGTSHGPLYFNCTWSDLTTNTFHAMVSGADGVLVLGSPVVVTGASNMKAGTGEDISAILHTGLANQDGYFTLGVDWTGYWIRHFINGVLVGEMPADSYAGELQRIQLQGGTVKATMKNLLIYDRPFQRKQKPAVRISIAGHSFIARQNLTIKTFDNGVIGGEVCSAFAMCAPEAMVSTIYQNINCEAEMYPWGASGADLAATKDRIINGTPESYAKFSGNYQDLVTRFRPHFCVIIGAIFNDNGTATATLETDVHEITEFLMGEGIIPVWVVEYQNANLELEGEYNAVIAECMRQKGINDIGLIDLWDHFGGLPAAQYRSYETASNHPNFACQPVIGGLIATEINRLLASPPNYSRLAGGAGEYQAVAAP